MPTGSERTWTASLPKTRPRVREPRPARGIIDTSVVIDLDHVEAEELPAEIAVAAVTLAELAAGPHATQDATERARRQQRLQLVEATFDAIPFDGAAARAYGRVYAVVVAVGRRARGRRVADLLIAATAVGAGLPLYTRNPDDFDGLDAVLKVHAISAHASP
jgi:predicted nucleic acid-binding protein